MLKNIFLMSCLLVSCSSPQERPENSKNENESTIEIFRYLEITTCYKNQSKCKEPVVKNIENGNVKFKMEPFSKGDRGMTANDIYSIVENEVQFQSEIRITKKENSDDYYVYSMIRSGLSSKREGKVKTVTIKDINNFSEIEILDSPIKFKDGTLQAKLVIAPRSKLLK